jgi:hypothetical protein
MKYFIFIIVSVFLFSCNVSMLVNKSRVVHEAQGYLLYYHTNKVLFIPNKDTAIDKFLQDTVTKKGYLLHSGCGIEGLKDVSKKLYIDMIYLDNKQEILLPDSVYITSTKFRYLRNKLKSIDYSDTIEFIYKGTKYKIEASDDFFGEVLSVEGNAR